MRNFVFEGNVLYYVRLIKRLYEEMLQSAGSECGLSLSEADVLSFLRENPEFDTAKDISIYREVSKGYVSKAVESLSKKGYITITINTKDRRIQHLKIADKAKQFAEHLHIAHFNFYEYITKSLTDEEMENMLLSIQKCANTVAQAFEK